MRIRFAFIALICFALTLGPMLSGAAAQDEQGARSGETEKEAEGEPVGADDVLAMQPAKPHWFNFVWRTGFGFSGTDLKIKYRHAPEGMEDTFEAGGGGSADQHIASGWFYPTSGRHFMLTFGFGGGTGQGKFETDERDTEFMDGKQFWRGYYIVPMGAGYRWLLGSEEQVSLNLFGELNWVYSSLYLEGAQDEIDLNGVGAGLVFGAHYRYDNGFLLGGAMELRGFGTAQKDTAILDELVDVRMNGNMLLFSIILGYEPGRR